MAVVVVVASSSAAVGAVGSAVGAIAAGSSEDSSQSEITIAHPIPVEDIPILLETIDEQVQEFKGYVAVESCMNREKSLDPESASTTQNIREFGATLAHVILDGVSDIVSVLPQALEEVREAGMRFYPQITNEQISGDLFNPVGNHEYGVEKGHEAIDQFFGVSQHHEASTIRPDFTYSVMPPPTQLGAIVAGEGRIAATQASSTCGWRVGQRIENRTFWGGVPKWSTVRGRYWKNRAQSAKSDPGNKFSSANISRMERGLAPQIPNRLTGEMESVELHHIPPQREGGLFDFIEVTPAEHADLDGCRRLKQ